MKFDIKLLIKYYDDNLDNKEFYTYRNIFLELRKYKYFNDVVNNENRIFLISCIKNILYNSNITKKSNICYVLRQNNDIIYNFIYLYYRLLLDETYKSFQIDRQINLLINIFGQIYKYRVLKCISIGSRFTNNQLYKNIIRRYIDKLLKKINKDSTLFDKIENGFLIINLFEKVPTIKSNVIELNKNISDIKCPCCNELMVKDLYLFCTECDYCNYYDEIDQIKK